jgi:glutathione S-transferase
MDWADATFMAIVRRLAYFQVLSAPGRLGEMFFPGAATAVQRVAGVAAALILRRRFGIDAERNRRDQDLVRQSAHVATDRLAGADHLVGDRLSLADITLAAMTAPLQYADRAVREDPHVHALLAWGSGVLGSDFSPLRPPASVPA